MKTYPNIVFFDSECVFCNFWVKKLLKIDKKKVFKIAPLKGNTAIEILSQDIIKNSDSVVVLSNNRVFTRSEAVFEILSQIGGIWKLFLIFKILTSFCLNFFYDFIAKRRLKWFGKQTECSLPDDRFLS